MYESVENSRLIFIGGAPRSGTTLLQNMLDCHEQICAGPEFLHLRDIINLRNKLYLSISYEYIDLFCTYDDVDRHLRIFIKNLLFPLADQQQCKFLCEKTPENILIFSELLHLFPQAHFIHMVRDPRAVVFSMQRVRKRAEQKGVPIPTFIQNITSSIQYTKRCIESGFNANKKVPGKILTVTYENIVTDPEAETKKICDFLRINWSQKMLFPANKKHLGEKAITKKSKEIWYTTRDYYRNPDTLRIGKWKKGLSFWEKLKINMSFQDSEELRMMDYNLSLESCFLKKDHWQASFIVLFDVFVKFYRQASPVVNHIPIFNWMKRVFFRLINT